jgi:enoyl-CoA hydratase
MDEGLDNALHDGHELEIEAFATCFQTADKEEGVSAFLEKRPAQFRGV